MTKQEFINSIVLTLAGQGITCEVGTATDINIAQEFLDANVGTEGKPVNYSASALFNEEKSEIYFWELTKETSFQSGKTLFRKVKSFVYAPDGRAVECSFDLGLIQKTFHEVAKQNGWKVKTALSQKKASYSASFQGELPTSPISAEFAQNPPITDLLKQGAVAPIQRAKTLPKSYLILGVILLLIVAGIVIFFLMNQDAALKNGYINQGSSVYVGRVIYFQTGQ